MINKILYHGTTDKFYPNFLKRPVFFVESIDYAYNHTLTYNDEIDDEKITRPIIVQCELLTNNFFDVRKDSHRQELINALPDVIEFQNNLLTKSYFAQQLQKFGNDSWKYLEYPSIIKILQTFNYDGHLAKEDNEITYCIYNPSNKKIKILKYISFLNIKEYEQIFDF